MSLEAIHLYASELHIRHTAILHPRRWRGLVNRYSKESRQKSSSIWTLCRVYKGGIKRGEMSIKFCWRAGVFGVNGAAYVRSFFFSSFFFLQLLECIAQRMRCLLSVGRNACSTSNKGGSEETGLLSSLSVLPLSPSLCIHLSFSSSLLFSYHLFSPFLSSPFERRQIIDLVWKINIYIQIKERISNCIFRS